MKEKNRLGAFVKTHGKTLLLAMLGAAALYICDEELFLLLVVMIPVVAALCLLFVPLHRRAMARAEARSEEYRPLPERKKDKPGAPKPTPPSLFIAAGRRYISERQLIALKTETERVHTDAYGRTVLALRERFPCFDSYDYLYEDRYYRWYFIVHDGALTLVRTQDDRLEYAVTERLTRAQWSRCGLDGYNQDVFRKLGFEQYLQETEGEET